MGSNDRLTYRDIVYACKYPVVRCPQYPRKVLINGVDERLKAILVQTAQEFQASGIELEIMPDPVHRWCEVDPQFVNHRLERCVKGRWWRLLLRSSPGCVRACLPCGRAAASL